MDFNKKKVLVVGSGKSGIAAVKLLLAAGANPYLQDGNTKLTQEQMKEKLGEVTIGEGQNLGFIIGDVEEEIKGQLDYVVLSPGVPTDNDFVNDLRDRNIPILGEIELAFTFEQGDVLAITGTNGKTTTTTLLGEIMKNYKESIYVVGNIGNPYTDEVTKTEKTSVTVAEISSFQLETVHSFRPVVSAILNVTPDHLDRHHTMENYVKAKEDIARNQTKAEICVLNYEDEYTREFAARCQATPVFFASAHELEDGFYYKDECIFKAVAGKSERLMNIHEMSLLGIHNVENVMAAIAMADAYHVPMDTILDTVRKFKAVEHRIEYVDTKNGVDYYNDSKGTNPDAAIKAVRAMIKPTYLIGGGYDKQSTYDEWIESFEGKVKALVLLGQTAEAIAECAKRHGFENYVLVDSLQEAVDYCSAHATEGEAVLLSPACASWGMFPNYEVRGNMFKDMVRAIK
ncbi:MAG: UDP-N-acetylmuramoyl-L-alanine--D-glutamate ligase [Lachnospiraceae bacterium]|nr:UDP-N-acetylmuramoyl-L-alanine--D-glutamate ligase [Lachnospiraceae bacterium]